MTINPPLGLKRLKVEYKHQCYRAAFDAAVKLARSDALPVVCHGPVNGSHACEGLRFNHAWTEVENDVYDWAATGMELAIPQEDYYRINGIIESEVKRYTVVEAVTLLEETDHYGPW